MHFNFAQWWAKQVESVYLLSTMREYCFENIASLVFQLIDLFIFVPGINNIHTKTVEFQTNY